MRSVFVFFVVAFLAGGALAKDEKKPPAKKQRPGIRWHGDLEAGMALAVREGRPILLAVNALENEGANIALATQHYRSPAWGEATRDYVCFVGNPNEHKGPDGLCTRYPGIPCATHQAVLRLVGKRFGADLISPQHIILEPDQRLAYRKEYYTRVVTPALLEEWLSAIAPDTAYSRAGIARERRIEQLVSAAAPERPQKVEVWLSARDGLAAAGIANALDQISDSAQRLDVIAQLGKTARLQAPVLEMVAEDAISYPDDTAEEALAWIQVLLKVDRETGLRAAARALSRSQEEKVRSKIVHACSGAKKLDLKSVAASERYPLWEALALAGDARGGPKAAAMPDDPTWRARIQRALRRGGLATGAVAVDLAGALEQPDDTAALRRALLGATAEQATQFRVVIEQVLHQARWLGVRAAAAVALVRAGVETEDDVVAKTLRATLFDAVEGPDIREAVRRLLGEEAGTNVDEWMRLIRARLRKPGEDR